jgi:hypothetical protein
MDKHMKTYRAHRAIAIFYAILIVLFVGGLAYVSLAGQAEGMPVAGMIMMFAFPVGTIIGIYLLVNAIPEWGVPGEAPATP